MTKEKSPKKPIGITIIEKPMDLSPGETVKITGVTLPSVNVELVKDGTVLKKTKSDEVGEYTLETPASWEPGVHTLKIK
ncbi:hypothetical protein CHM34_06410 [Paludifilum halophilum]|uniref:Bacterial Ig domain-containing protein n=2 Tax=Paludifilum halophilum TaxID=1642702 RepID=A0A235B811_9BACL|nr:hypothetical protein CHM34_06410 [Paludifilum halophilum]